VDRCAKLRRRHANCGVATKNNQISEVQMPSEIVVPCWTRGRMWPTLVYFAVASVSSLRLYESSYAAGPWTAAAIFVTLIGVPAWRFCLKRTFVLSGQPKAIRYELRFLGIRLGSEIVDPVPITWVRSRTGSFDPRDTLIELGREHSYDALTVQRVKYALGETPEVIATRGEIADVLGIVDRGHERLPPQRTVI
jgi:hypothetical protein